jgi:hypothetical protein
MLTLLVVTSPVNSKVTPKASTIGHDVEAGSETSATGGTFS